MKIATSAPLDAQASNPRMGGASFSVRQRLTRVIFTLTWLMLAAWLPPSARAWRRLLLRMFGAQIGRGANVYGSVKIWYPANLVLGNYAVLGPRVRCYNQATITLGDFAIVSQDASLCAGTHDYQDQNFQLLTKPITIGTHAWVAAEAFVGPGVDIGDHAVLGARGVAMRNLEPYMVYSGNPARPLKTRQIRDA